MLQKFSANQNSKTKFVYLIKILEMTYAEKNIIETYSNLIENLSSIGKLELLEKLAKSLKREKKSKEKDFYSSFGAFSEEKSAEEIIAEIKESRKFREKDLKL